MQLISRQMRSMSKSLMKFWQSVVQNGNEESRRSRVVIWHAMRRWLHQQIREQFYRFSRRVEESHAINRFTDCDRMFERTRGRHSIRLSGWCYSDTYMTNYIVIRMKLDMSLHLMSREHLTQQMDMPEQQVKLVYVWQQADPEQLI